MSKKIAIVLIVIILGALLINQLPRLLKNKGSAVSINTSASPAVSEKDPPKIVSTKPDNLEETIVAADQTIEITFNRPLENVGEFKVRIEPKPEYKLELSGDRKTGKIIPIKPYELGQEYTIFIGSDTKFDGVGNWGQEKIFHFKTVKYTGV